MKKRNICMILLCLCAFLLNGCAGSEVMKEMDYGLVCGKVENNVYSNDYFQIQCAPDDNYVFLDDDEVAEIYQTVKEDRDPDFYEKQLMENKIAVVAIAVNPDEGETMVINVVDIGNDDPTPDDILEASKEEAAPAGVEAVSTEVETCDFLGEESACLRFHGIQNENDVYQQHRVYIKDGYYIQVCMSSYNKDETDDMFTAVSKIEE